MSKTKINRSRTYSKAKQTKETDYWKMPVALFIANLNNVSGFRLDSFSSPFKGFDEVSFTMIQKRIKQ